MKSQCCNADIEIDNGGVGVFALTTGAFICTSCRKYCTRSQQKEKNFGEKIPEHYIQVDKDEKLNNPDDPNEN